LQRHRDHWWERHKLGTGKRAYANHINVLYSDLVDTAIAMELPSYPLIRCVCPSWDNTARRKTRGAILRESTPADYGRWLAHIVRQSAAASPNGMPHQSLVFINAWNEWAEGNHLEPCQKWGRSYLEATLRALSGLSARS
jgi:hypothetical protein